jgi:hypothetical protein
VLRSRFRLVRPGGGFAVKGSCEMGQQGVAHSV